jgi:hypothetical protein
MTKKESDFQSSLIRELKSRFAGAIVTKLDSSQIQGLPDLLVLYKNRWASLECKRSETSPHQPNQDYYVNKMNEMSFSRFINPSNKEEVLNEMAEAFESGR